MSTNDQHTPGPWEFLPPEDGCCGAIITKTGWVCDFDVSPSEANARLIAAAPDLLEALKEADEDFEREGFDPEGPYRAHIRAAIAKATGGA